MSAMSSAVSSGVVLGIVLVFLVQQFGLLALTGLLWSLIAFVVGALAGGIVFGAAARQARPSAPPPTPSS